MFAGPSRVCLGHALALRIASCGHGRRADRPARAPGLCLPFPECLAHGVADWGAARGGTAGNAAVLAGAGANAALEVTGANLAGQAGQELAEGHPVASAFHVVLALPLESEGRAAAKLTRWGWEGAAKHSAALRQLGEAATHLEVGGIIPTRAEAERLINQAGGTIERIERAHAPGTGHTVPHINYVTSMGEKATVRVQSVGRQFIRNP